MKGFGLGLLVVMFIGAANADATNEQRARLRDEVLPVLGDQDTPPRQAMANAVLLTGEIMGSKWRPKGEWEEWITNLLEDQDLLR